MASERLPARARCRMRRTRARGAIGRPQIASVSRKRRASRDSAASRLSNISANGGLPVRLRTVDAGIAGQLFQHERAAARFARNPQSCASLERRIGGKQRAEQLASLRIRHRTERKGHPHVPIGAFQQLSEKWLAGDLLASERHHRQQTRRIWRPQQFLEQQRAVRIRPMQVVDGDDHPPAIRAMRTRSSRNAANARRLNGKGSDNRRLPLATGPGDGRHPQHAPGTGAACATTARGSELSAVASGSDTM